MISLAFSKTRTSSEGCLIRSREVYLTGFSILEVVLETPRSHKGESNGNIKATGKHDQHTAG